MNNEWDDFASRLLRTLRVIGERVYVVISSAEAPGRFVQFAGLEDRILAETPPKRLLQDMNEASLTVAGWKAPVSERDNWSMLAAIGMDEEEAAEYVEFTNRCVVALRDALGITSAKRLVYTAWRNAEKFPEGVTLFEEQIDDLDSGENPLPLPQLGLPME